MEVWKDIPGYEGKYQVSDLGRVKSLRMWSSVQNRYVQRERILKPYLGTAGYLQINLKTEGTRKLAMMHRLVAAAFIPNPEGKEDVNHKNGDKTDNRAENLEWNTRQENIIHSYEHGLQNHYTRKILQYDMQGNIVKEWDSIGGAADGTNTERRNINACCRCKRKSAGGYIWRYKEAE